MKLDHLTDQDHAEAARLLEEVQDRLSLLVPIGNRAPWSDSVLRVKKAVQEKLIDPLREARDASRERRGELPEREGIYPSVHYGVRQ